MEQTITSFAHNITGHFFGYIDVLTIGVSLILFFAARPICRRLNEGNDLGSRVSMMRTLNALIIGAVIAKVLWFSQVDWFPKLAQSLIVIYFAVLFTQVVNYFIRQRFGKKRETNNKISIADTYSSRGLSLLVTILMAIIAIISCLQLLGLTSLLEAGGAIGIIGLVLAMTQAAWAPDIISGLIILNSKFCEDGDVIQFTMDGKEVTAIIFKTKLFHTECLDLANNHRVMVRNAKLRDFGIQNLSRFASAKGLREVLLFNIDYRHSEQEVSAMIARTFKTIDQQSSVREDQYDTELRVHDTGDYAVTWAVYYYIKDVRKIFSARQYIRSVVLAEAHDSNISLATPILQSNQVTLNQSAGAKPDRPV